MESEIERFFSAINFKTNSFDDCYVEKVIKVKENDSFIVYICSKSVVLLKDIDLLYEASKRGLRGKKLMINFAFDCDINLFIDDYLNYHFDKLIEKRPSFSFFKDYELEIEGNDIKLKIFGSLSLSETKEQTEKLSGFLKYYGFRDINVEIIVSDEQAKSLQESIMENKNIKFEVKEDPMILGKEIKGNVMNLNNIFSDTKGIVVEVQIFDMEISEKAIKKKNKGKSGDDNGFVYIANLKITDKTDSFLAKFVKFDETEFYKVANRLKQGSWYKMFGNFEVDQYMKQLVFTPKCIESIKTKDVIVVDNAENKRVELHAHTTMSMMDGMIDAKALVKHAVSLGHRAVAVTDHNVLQSYPDLFNSLWGINKDREEKFKILYGVEMNVVDTESQIVYNEREYSFKDQEFIVFDTETTGLNAGTDQLIEIGAVRVKNGEIIDRFDELIACDRPLPQIITQLTCITDEMLVGKDSEENVTKRFLEYIKDTPLIAHNASFDISFINASISRYNLSEFKNTVLDTMALARTVFPEWRNHKLSTLVKNLKVEWDEEKHHRADYDSEGTAACFYKIISKLDSDEIHKISDLHSLVDVENIIKFARPFHLTMIAKNMTGLKNLFKIVSIANTKYLYKGKEPKIPRKDLMELSEGLLIGSGCANGEVFEKGFNLDDDELRTMMNFYDYIEIYPASAVSHKIGNDKQFRTEMDYYEYLRRLIRVAKSIDKIVVATGDVHNLTKEDLLSRKIIVSQKTNGRLHPLNRKDIEVPNQYFLTTDEMLEAFSFLEEEEQQEIVIENTNKIADLVEELEIIKKDLYTPLLDNSADITREMVYNKAHEIYGENMPDSIRERIEAELNGIIGGGFDVIYLIAEKLVKKSNADGYFVGSRGSVGSSLVATLMGITEVNGLPAHYVCPKCKKTLFEHDGKVLAEHYSSGYDMPDLICECGESFKKEGQDMPFATFLGFKAEKVPDIDLNFSGDNQADAHNYVKELFGEMNAYRAGTISTVKDKTAFGYVRAYCEEKGIISNPIEIERIAKGCTGVKRTSGQHPGGIIVIPQNMDVFDFTAYQYPADEPDSSWYTTHFDFHAIHDNVLKLDILGHDDPTMLRYLGDETGVDVEKITFDDEKVLSLFNSPEALGVEESQILCPTGTLGIPEFGTNFVINMLLEIKPKKFSDLVKISGLSHGTNVWQGNVRDLIVDNVATFDKVVGCRDDIMVFLINYGMEPSAAFKISEFVRKGRGKKEPDAWATIASDMRSVSIPEWFIESCRRIEYMFPKAHACAYVMMAYRVAWFKVYYPLYYYSAFFSIRRSDFDVEAMVQGIDGIRRKIAEIKEKGYSASAKEVAVADTLNVALEMMARGMTFTNINVEKSDAQRFIVDDENNTLIIPFMALDGLGEAVAYKIIEEREIKPYYCIEDLATRGKVNKTAIQKLRDLGVFEGMNESAQLSLF
ncbi:MAG: PolC-type DNA polymerase III [bacterium]